VKTSAAGIDLIKSVEGCKLIAYLCPARVWTIGYGHTGPDVFEGLKITKAKAESLLKADLAEFERCVITTCPKSTQSQFDAMVSLAFNIGAGAFAKSSVARLHKAGRYPEAQQAFALWNKATVSGKKIVVNGLVTRRAREADLYDNDDLPTDIEDMPQTVEGERPTSRVFSGSSVAGGATVVSMAGPSLWDGLGEVKSTVLEIMPYLQDVNFHLVLGAIVLSALAYVAHARWQDRREGRS
jgi:lysozyme